MDYTEIDISTMSTEETYKFLVGAVVPRPVALISTLNLDGSANCAPFSSFNLVSSDPPTVLFTVYQGPRGSEKDTLVNIERTREFVVSFPSESQAAQVAQAGAAYPYGVSEIEESAFVTLPGRRVCAPRIVGAHTHLECELYQLVAIGDKATLIIGRIVAADVQRNAWKDGRIDERCIAPLARLGGAAYAGMDRYVNYPIPRLHTRAKLPG